MAAMRGAIDSAEELNKQARAYAPDPGELLDLAADAISESFVAMYADNPHRAAGILRKRLEQLFRQGIMGSAGDVAALLARASLRSRQLGLAMDAVTVCEEAERSYRETRQGTDPNMTPRSSAGRSRQGFWPV